MLIQDRIRELRRVTAGELRPNPKNWRKHPKAQQDAIRGVLAEVGIADALLARELPDGTLMLIDGHLRADTDPATVWPVLVLDVSESEADKLLATVDPLAAMAESDTEKLDALLREVNTSSEAVAKMLEDLGKEAGCDWAKTGEVVEDEVPEPPVDPVTKPGDLWLLGEHRLLCGDSTKAEDVGRVMDGTKAALLCTDPPYNLGEKWNGLQAMRGNEQVANDAKGDAWFAWAAKALKAWGDLALIDNCPCYWWFAFVASPRAVIEADGFTIHGTIVWIKEHYNVGRADYHSQYEPCLYFSRGRRYWCGRRDLSDVWHAKRVEQERVHPNQKPVSIIAKCIENSTSATALVYDPFLGSGTTLIAAEQLGRRCYGLELEPKYCDVIVERWEKLTGKKAELQHA